MGAYSWPGKQVLGTLGEHRFADVVCPASPAGHPVIARGVTRTDGAPEALWQSLGRNEQESFIELMAELSYRVARDQSVR